VYRYVIESPDRSPQELKTIEDWVLERQYKQVPGVADDSGFGGTVMQYQVLLDPAKLYAYHVTVPTVVQQLSVNNSNAGGGFYEQGQQSDYVTGVGWCATRRTSPISSWARRTACPRASGTSGRW
jgi:cobalt-zinc-cadmium resistance protein CzcA